MTEDLFNILGKIILYIGSGTTIAYFIFKHLSKKWLDNLFDKRLEEFKRYQNEQLESYKFKINSVFNRITKIHEKEFEVLPEIWSKFVSAYRGVNILISPFEQIPDFENNTPDKIREYLSNNNFTDDDINEIMKSTDKITTYRKINLSYDYAVVSKDLQDFHDFVQYNKIFLRSDLFDLFTKVDSHLFEAMQFSKDKYRFNNTEFLELLQNKRKIIDPLKNEIERNIQERLRLDEA